MHDKFRLSLLLCRQRKFFFGILSSKLGKDVLSKNSKEKIIEILGNLRKKLLRILRPNFHWNFDDSLFKWNDENFKFVRSYKNSKKCEYFNETIIK